MLAHQAFWHHHHGDTDGIVDARIINRQNMTISAAKSAGVIMVRASATANEASAGKPLTLGQKKPV